jgi:hypothetical protein
MMQNKALLTIALCALSILAQAQNVTSSTYSRFGIGMLQPRADASAAGMGYTGLALPSKGYINPLNPASFSSLDSTRFLFNIQGKMEFGRFASSSKEQTNVTGTADLISIGFRAGKNWGMGFSISPFSAVGYQVTNEKYIAGTNTTYPVTYDGSGGISQISWFNGVQLTKNLSVGLNSSLIWGNTTMLETSFFPEINGITMYNERKYNMANFMLEYGFQLSLPVGKHKLMLGGTGNILTELNTFYTHRIFKTQEIDDKKFYDNTDNYFIPSSYKGGIGFEMASGWLFAGDYRYEEWSESDLKITSGEVKNTHSGSFGIQYASPRFHESLLKRMQYRAGVFYNQMYYTLEGQDLDERGFTAGVTVPMRDGTRINIAYEYKQAGTKSIGLIKETYNTIRFGITFNEKWFQKRQFN